MVLLPVEKKKIGISQSSKLRKSMWIWCRIKNFTNIIKLRENPCWYWEIQILWFLHAENCVIFNTSIITYIFVKFLMSKRNILNKEWWKSSMLWCIVVNFLIILFINSMLYYFFESLWTDLDMAFEMSLLYYIYIVHSHLIFLWIFFVRIITTLIVVQI